MKSIQVHLAITLSEESAAAVAEILVPAIKQAIQSVNEEGTKVTGRQGTSKNASMAHQKLPDDQGLLLTSKETAKLLKLSEKTIYNMHTSGQMPAPIRIGAAVRWSLEALNSWISAGCPAVAQG